MTEERITTTETPAGERHTTHTTVIHDGAERRGGSGKWIAVLLVLVAIVAAAYFLSQPDASEVAANNAVENAANEVGEAAGSIGDAVQDVADGE